MKLLTGIATPLDIPHIMRIEFVILVPQHWSEGEIVSFIEEKRRHKIDTYSGSYNIGTLTHYYFGSEALYLMDREHLRN